MKKIIILLLCAALLLCGCAGNQAKDDKGNSDDSQLSEDDIVPEKEIIDDVMILFELDESGEKSVARLFADLDKAYQKASSSDKSNQDYLDYAKEVKQKLDAFDETFDWAMWDRKLGGSTTLPLEEAMAAYNLGDPLLKLLTIDDLFNGLEDKEPSDDCSYYAHVACLAVNYYSEFFYGEACYTEDEMF